jgi:hypothetical protein
MPLPWSYAVFRLTMKVSLFMKVKVFSIFISRARVTWGWMGGREMGVGMGRWRSGGERGGAKERERWR